MNLADLTPLQISLRAIESILANDENSTDEELRTHFLTQCPEVEPALIDRLIAQERPKFFCRVLHYINWPAYGYPYLEGEKPAGFKGFVAGLQAGYFR